MILPTPIKTVEMGAKTSGIQKKSISWWLSGENCSNAVAI